MADGVGCGTGGTGNGTSGQNGDCRRIDPPISPPQSGGTGTTGKKQTEIKQEDDVTVHDYTVYVNVDSISNPVETINVGNNANLANEILGLFNIIISRNNVMK